MQTLFVVLTENLRPVDSSDSKSHPLSHPQAGLKLLFRSHLPSSFCHSTLPSIVVASLYCPAFRAHVEKRDVAQRKGKKVAGNQPSSHDCMRAEIIPLSKRALSLRSALTNSQRPEGRFSKKAISNPRLAFVRIIRAVIAFLGKTLPPHEERLRRLPSSAL